MGAEEGRKCAEQWEEAHQLTLSITTTYGPSSQQLYCTTRYTIMMHVTVCGRMLIVWSALQTRITFSRHRLAGYPMLAFSCCEQRASIPSSPVVMRHLLCRCCCCAAATAAATAAGVGWGRTAADIHSFIQRPSIPPLRTSQ